jgi:hypothetical protein
MIKINVIPAPSVCSSNQPKPPKGQAGIYLLLVLCFFAVSAYAKPKEQPPKPITADDIVAKMKIQLGLTEKQVDEAKPIIKDYLAKELQLKLEEHKQLSKVLTGEQMFTWNFLQNEKPREKKKKSAL